MHSINVVKYVMYKIILSVIFIVNLISTHRLGAKLSTSVVRNDNPNCLFSIVCCYVCNWTSFEEVDFDQMMCVVNIAD